MIYRAALLSFVALSGVHGFVDLDKLRALTKNLPRPAGLSGRDGSSPAPSSPAPLSDSLPGTCNATKDWYRDNACCGAGSKTMCVGKQIDFTHLSTHEYKSNMLKTGQISGKDIWRLILPSSNFKCHDYASPPEGCVSGLYDDYTWTPVEEISASDISKCAAHGRWNEIHLGKRIVRFGPDTDGLYSPGFPMARADETFNGHLYTFYIVHEPFLSEKRDHDEQTGQDKLGTHGDGRLRVIRLKKDTADQNCVAVAYQKNYYGRVYPKDTTAAMVQEEFSATMKMMLSKMETYITKWNDPNEPRPIKLTDGTDMTQDNYADYVQTSMFMKGRIAATFGIADPSTVKSSMLTADLVISKGVAVADISLGIYGMSSMDYSNPGAPSPPPSPPHEPPTAAPAAERRARK